MKLFGLIGKSLAHSFSANHFNQFFKSKGLSDHVYLNIELSDIREFKQVISQLPELRGLNVTIPYKSDIIPFLDDLDPNAKLIGAVNTVKFKDGSLVGFNTDWIGFTQSLPKQLKLSHLKSLVLGSGGASKAVVYALNQLNHEITVVSQTRNDLMSYEDISDLSSYDLIINTTPLGMLPDIDKSPQLPYDTLSGNETLYDLIYNPEITLFMKNGQDKACQTINGLEMLRKQAEASWEIWIS